MAEEVRDPNQIVLAKWYSFHAASRFIPSAYGDQCIARITLERWRKRGDIKRECLKYRPHGKTKRQWFIKGAAILELIGNSQVAAPEASKGTRARVATQAGLAGEGFKHALD